MKKYSGLTSAIFGAGLGLLAHQSQASAQTQDIAIGWQGKINCAAGTLISATDVVLTPDASSGLPPLTGSVGPDGSNFNSDATRVARLSVQKQNIFLADEYVIIKNFAGVAGGICLAKRAVDNAPGVGNTRINGFPYAPTRGSFTAEIQALRLDGK